MQIILIGNYPLDKQESMIRFAEMLKRGLHKQGIGCHILQPKVVFGKYVKTTASGFGKWVGYIDKWIVFPGLLRLKFLKSEFRNSEVRFHICDHSNSPYLRHLPKEKASITCHDVLAIRGAFGYDDAHCPASRLGKYYQKWILGNLLRADKIACDSQATLNNLKDFVVDEKNNQKKWEVIHCAFNANFYPLVKNQAKDLLQKAGVPAKPYLLNVGSNLQRKNRRLLIDMIASLGDKWDGNILYAGDPADEELLNYAVKLGCRDRIVSVSKPDHETLVALYSECEALIFPSFSEGFGWSVIEAQACGAPVIASNVEPMPEVSGGAALYADPYQPETFVTAFLSLQNPDEKKAVIEKGFENAKRFELAKMIDAYLKLLNAS